MQPNMPTRKFGLVIALAAIVAFAATPVFAQNNSSGSSSTSQSGSNSSAAMSSNNQSSSSSSSSSSMSANSQSSSSSSPQVSVATARKLVLNHWTAVANRNATGLGNEYAKDAVVAWVGGGLNGTYTGKNQIDTMWSKFAGATTPMRFDVTKVSYDLTNDRPAIDETVVLHNSKGSIHVDSTIVYNSNQKIIAEIWKLDKSTHSS
jgi:cytoskeletal protein RodZ